jgi:hypothetical protein
MITTTKLSPRIPSSYRFYGADFIPGEPFEISPRSLSCSDELNENTRSKSSTTCEGATVAPEHNESKYQSFTFFIFVSLIRGIIIPQNALVDSASSCIVFLTDILAKLRSTDRRCLPLSL